MAKVLTNEKMHTNTSYPNDELKGMHLSLGYQIETGNINLRVEAGYSEYEDISVTGSGGDGTQNTVTVKDLTGPHARLSLVKSF